MIYHTIIGGHLLSNLNNKKSVFMLLLTSWSDSFDKSTTSMVGWWRYVAIPETFARSTELIRPRLELDLDMG